MNQSYEEEISLMELLGMLYKKRKQIIVTFLIVTLLATIYAFVPAFEKEKEYDAVSSMSIIYNYKAPANPEEIGEGYVYYQDRMQNVMIPTIKGYAQSLTILRNIISDLDIRDNEGELIKARKLAEDIEIENVEGSNLITITVKYKDEKLAADIASELEGSGKLLTIAIGMVLGWAKAKNIDFQILSYTSNEFIIKAKEVDRTFIIIQENITEIKPVKELSKLLTKYNKDFSGMFIEI